MIPDVQSHFETPKKIGLNPQKSYDFLITLVTIMFISGGYAIWFISTYLYAYDEADFVYTPKVHRAKAAEVATSTVDTTDWQTYRNEEYGFEFKYPKDWKLEEFAQPNYSTMLLTFENKLDISISNEIIKSEDVCDNYYNKPQENWCFDKGPMDSLTTLKSNNKISAVFYCWFPERQNNISTCTQILSTFKFLSQ